MKQTDKEILMKDLCEKLLYKTYVKTAKGIGYVYAINNSQLVELSVANNSEYWSEVFNIDKIKPYLRPMTSMTEEEVFEIDSMGFSYWTTMINNDLRHRGPMSLLDAIITHHKMVKLIDWLNEHHIDYRGLIEKGLALEAPKDMYK